MLSNMFNKLLTQDEKSFFITEITNPETVEAPVEEIGEDESENNWT